MYKSINQSFNVCAQYSTRLCHHRQRFALSLSANSLLPLSFVNPCSLSFFLSCTACAQRTKPQRPGAESQLGQKRANGVRHCIQASEMRWNVAQRMLFDERCSRQHCLANAIQRNAIQHNAIQPNSIQQRTRSAHAAT